MAKFVYNNAKNASIGHTPFELNCGYHLHVFFKDKNNPYSKSQSAKKFTKELKDLKSIYQQNLLHA